MNHSSFIQRFFDGNLEQAKQELERLYRKENLSLRQLGKHYDVSDSTIWKNMKRLSMERKPIVRKPLSETRLIKEQFNGDLEKARETLQKLYIDENWTMDEIGSYYGGYHKTTVDKALKGLNIQRKYKSKSLSKRILIKEHFSGDTHKAKQCLHDLYWNKNWSAKRIAQFFGYTSNYTIQNTLRDLGIKVRTIKEACKHYARLFNHISDEEFILRHWYKDYEDSAKKRNLEFELTKFQFKELVSQPCAYCGRLYDISRHRYVYEDKKLYKTITIQGSGIDRIDNKQGYVMSNCIPCCKDCNFSKNSRTQSDFLDWVSRVYHHYICFQKS